MTALLTDSGGVKAADVLEGSGMLRARGVLEVYEMESQPPSQFIPVARLSELDPRGRAVVTVQGERVAILRVAGELFAIQDTCPHRGGPLSEGDVEGYLLHCPLHAWPFDVRSGLCPIIRGARIRTYPLRVVGEEIQVAPFSGRVSNP